MLRSKIIIIAAVLLTACSSSTEEGYRQQLESLRGISEAQLISRFGQPDKMKVASNGRKALRYENIRYYIDHGITTHERETTDYTGKVTSGMHSANFSATGTRLVTVQGRDELRMTFCLTSLIISSNGIVENFNFDGPDCVAPERGH